MKKQNSGSGGATGKPKASATSNLDSPHVKVLSLACDKIWWSADGKYDSSRLQAHGNAGYRHESGKAMGLSEEDWFSKVNLNEGQANLKTGNNHGLVWDLTDGDFKHFLSSGGGPVPLVDLMFWMHW